MSDTLTPRLAAFATDPALTPSDDALQVARLSALDWIAVGRAGAQDPVAQIVRDMVLDDGGTARASLFGSDIRVPARGAALANGTTSHALDYDDTHFAHIGHPSVAVFSAALAVGEADATTDAVIWAALMGMELSVRVGLWLGRSHYQVGFHQTATAGAFGATAAAGRLLGLSADQMEHALGLTATRAAGLKAQFGTMGKPYNAGIAAATGVECAQLVARGFQANPAAMQGEYGFGAVHHGENAQDAALEGLGDVWLFETVSHKFHACCHGLHATLEALRSLDVAEPEIARLTIRTSPRWMSVCNQPAPTTGLGAKFSYGTVAAMQVLGHDTARLESYSDAICADPRVQALRGKVEVEADAAMSETAAQVQVLCKDGRVLTASHDLNATLDMAERKTRVLAKAAALIGVEPAQEAWDVVNAAGPALALGSLIRP